jgi:hypothetical protein
MNLMEMATEAGLQILLDARIGSLTYHSVSGPLPALQRFADAVKAATLAESRKRRKSRSDAKRRISRHPSARTKAAHHRPFACRRRRLSCSVQDNIGREAR